MNVKRLKVVLGRIYEVLMKTRFLNKNLTKKTEVFVWGQYGSCEGAVVVKRRG